MTFLRLLIADFIASIFIGVSLWLVTIFPKGFSSNNLSTISSFAFYMAILGFLIIAILGFPVVTTLKKFNKLNWKYVLSYSFIIGFILMSLLLQVWRYESIFSIERGTLLQCFILGIAAMITGAIFYQTLKILERK